MINLKMIDLVIIDSVKPNQANIILNHCKKFINFGRTIIFTHEIFDCDNEIILIDEISSLNEYSNFVLRLDNYIKNDFTLIVQRDGFITSPHMWNYNFLSFDYIGAPFSKYKGDHNVGNGGFSLRSKYFLEFSKQFSNTNGRPEDVFLTIDNYDYAISKDISFAPRSLASEFSFENARWSNLKIYNSHNHFGFHGSFLYSFLYKQRPDLHYVLDEINND